MVGQGGIHIINQLKVEVKMLSKISNQIDNINDSLAWIKANKNADYKVKFINLIEQRRKLNVVKRAFADNPAIAAFGKSQVGKSYLMSCLLQKRENDGIKPFKVCASNKEYDFIKEINPIGDGKEATGVVTRFSSFKRSSDRFSSIYPVLVRCLSITDLLTILCDSYFNDLHNYSTPSESEIKNICAELAAKYINSPNLSSPVITADEILGMKQYFKKHINNAQIFDNCSFFSEIALIIEKVSPENYIDVFKLLWNEDTNISRLFLHVMAILKRLNYSEYVYLPVEAVLHEGIKENTVMSVECLKHLFDSSNSLRTNVFLKDGSSFTDAGSFTKSEVCAVAAEVVYRIDEGFLESTNRYCTDSLSASVKSSINCGDITMSILKDNDLLDFPGARSREQEDCNKLSENSILLYCFLRGKVAYLFNKYNEALLINILLYCHHNKDNDVTDLWHLLDEWVRNNVGATPEKRHQTLEKTKVSPLFYVGTMFNLDMKYNDSDVENNTNAINGRWKGRFETVLNNQCFHRDSVEWVKNWCAKDDFFKNSYLLRDYKYSGPNQSCLYSGFNETGIEKNMIIPEPYYNDMRETFVSNRTVKELFESPERAWELATTMNNDGSLFIIENLKVVASLMDVARDALFEEKLSEVTRKVQEEIKDYYISTDKDKILESNIRKAKSVLRELSFTCNIDNYYFGHLLQALQVTEVEIYKIIHEDIMQHPDILNSTNDFVNYEIIHKDCESYGNSLADCKSVDECWKALLSTYAFADKDEAIAYLASKKVDPNVLFDIKRNRKMKNSQVIADYIYNNWCEGFRSVSFMNTFCGDNMFDSGIMSNFIDNIVETSKQVHLSDYMANSISPYVDVVNVHNANESFLADILASIINDFILDLGFSTYDEERINNIRLIGERNKLPIFKYICKEMPSRYSEQQLTDMFNTMSTNPMALIPSFEEHYYKWVEYVYISYIAHLEYPDFDVEANNSLSNILERIKAVNIVEN